MNEESRKLLEKLDEALVGQRGAVARMLGACVLAEEREQYRAEGFPSLVALLTEKHQFDPEEARCRVAIAHVAMKYPAVRDVLVYDRIGAADWKKSLGQLTPAKAVARAFVELCIERPCVGIEIDDDEEDDDAQQSPALAILNGGAPSPPGSARRLRP